MSDGRRLIGSCNHGSMANALPQAIGAQLACPKRQVASLSGDGGFAMLMGEVLTLIRYDLPIKLIVFNNSSLGMVTLEMRVAGLEDFGVDVKPTNFAKIADALGIRGFRVENAADLKDSLRAAVRHKGPGSRRRGYRSQRTGNPSNGECQRSCRLRNVCRQTNVTWPAIRIDRRTQRQFALIHKCSYTNGSGGRSFTQARLTAGRSHG
jgi:hypothetical protein